MALPATARVFEVHARTYRRVWRGSVITTFINPILFLAAMGLGLGTLVDDSGAAATLDTVDYLTFLAPGLLAATTMQTAAGDSSYPVMAGIKWVKTYDAMLATPVGIAALVYGHVAWVAVRTLFVALVFVAISIVFDAMSVTDGLLAVLPATLIGLAFGAAVMAFTARLKNEMGLSSLFRFAIVPMFLFSGTFFPISQLPDWMEPVAFVVPLWHGVELTRGAALSQATELDPIAHVAYLAVWGAAGTWLAVRILGRRLQP